MKTLFKLAALGGLAAIAVNIYRRQQRYSRELPESGAERRDADMVADTNTVTGGDPVQEQLSPQPQDWRGAQNVLE